jgi:hypothetical protein
MFAGIFALSCCAQDLAPRAYTITPLRSNAVIVTNSFFHGSIDYNGVVPIDNATGTYNIPSLSYYHSFDFFGRSANIVASLPYGVGGGTSLNGVENSLTKLSNSRIGATISVPTSKHQSLKVSYSNGVFIDYGGNYQSVSVAWQYSWLGRP